MENKMAIPQKVKNRIAINLKIEFPYDLKYLWAYI
jgi:hypothetical protein